jgi:alcohol dehydrogenase
LLTITESVGADMLVNAANEKDVVGQIMEITRGGVHVSIDALGNPETCFNSIANLRKRGKHVQVGLMLADQSRPAIPMDRVIAWELEILGSPAFRHLSIQQYWP